MNKKIGVIAIAITSIIITGCTQKPSVKMVENEKSTISSEVEIDQEVIKDKNQETHENEATEVYSELITKKEHYLERMKKIYDQYENIRTEFEIGNLPTVDMRNITVESYEGYDKILNEIYQDLKTYLPSSKMEDIKKEQLNWISEKESQREYLIEISTGLITDQQMVYMTETRCKELLEYFTDDKVEEIQDSSSNKNSYTSNEILEKAIEVLESKNYYDSNDSSYEIYKIQEFSHNGEVYHEFRIICYDAEYDFGIAIGENTLNPVIVMPDGLKSIDSLMGI